MIRVVYTVDAPFLGGAEHYVSRLATSLDRARFAPAVLMRADVHPSLGPWIDELERAGVPVARAQMRLPFHPGDAVGIVRALGRFEPHVVHVNMPGPYSGQTALLAPLARAAGARVVVTEHLPMVERLWKRACVKRLAIGAVDVAVTMTRANAALLVGRQGYPRAKVRVVENGVPRAYGAGIDPAAERSRLGIEAGTVAFVFVGNLIPHKGLRTTIEALWKVRRGAWKLFVVGEGPDQAASHALALRLGLADRVSFLGARPAAEVERVVGACDALVLPSSVEGMPYVILEAMACAKPVVSTRAFGIPEAVVDDESGLLVEPGDVGALSHALERVAADAALRARLGRAARERFEARFTLERHVARMSALYRELATSVPARGAQ